MINKRLVHEILPKRGNPRNSEGAFLRSPNGDILYAYSRYSGDSIHDHAACDIALISSADEGESWSEPVIIAEAESFDVKNIMSVSAVEQLSGEIGFYFLIKENNFTTTLGRALSRDGVNFRTERCGTAFPEAYYVLCNDRILRLSDGRLVAPVAYNSAEENRTAIFRESSVSLLISDNDGKGFYKADFDLTTRDKVNSKYGLQEPGLIERSDGSLYLFMRTGYGRQYEAQSAGDVNDFQGLQPSEFTSPDSPMQMKEYDGAFYAVYNPVPRYNGRWEAEGTLGRTPLVIRKSVGWGAFGKLNVIEDDGERGFCYPAVFKTRDGHLLVAYCRGGAEDGNTLCRIGIVKIDAETLE